MPHPVRGEFRMSSAPDKDIEGRRFPHPKGISGQSEPYEGGGKPARRAGIKRHPAQGQRPNARTNFVPAAFW